MGQTGREIESREIEGNRGRPSERLCRWRDTNKEAGRGSEVEKAEMQRPQTGIGGEGWRQIGREQPEPERQRV